MLPASYGTLKGTRTSTRNNRWTGGRAVDKKQLTMRAFPMPAAKNTLLRKLSVHVGPVRRGIAGGSAAGGHGALFQCRRAAVRGAVRRGDAAGEGRTAIGFRQLISGCADHRLSSWYVVGARAPMGPYASPRAAAQSLRERGADGIRALGNLVERELRIGDLGCGGIAQ